MRVTYVPNRLMQEFFYPEEVDDMSRVRVFVDGKPLTGGYRALGGHGGVVVTLDEMPAVGVEVAVELAPKEAKG